MVPIRWTFEPETGTVLVEGRYSFCLLGDLWWNVPREGHGAGIFCRGYAAGSPQELAYVGIVDVTDDPDEPWISHLQNDAALQAYDRFLEADTRTILENQGDKLIRWMGSVSQSHMMVPAILTCHIGEEDGLFDRQYTNLRFEDAGRKLVLAAAFNVADAEQVAAPVMASLSTLHIDGRSVIRR